jgi:hypothetical protein
MHASANRIQTRGCLLQDRYDFVSDVNVSEAQAMVDPSASSGPQALFSGSNAIFSEVNALIDAAVDDDDGGPQGFQVGVKLDAAGEVLGGSESNVLAVSLKLPVRMRRVKWSINDYQLLKQLHKGYASEVFQVRCPTETMRGVLCRCICWCCIPSCVRYVWWTVCRLPGECLASLTYGT